MGYFQYCHYGDCYYRLWLTKNMRGFVGMDQTFCGDGSESVRGRMGMDVKSVGMVGDGTKIPSPCTPLGGKGESFPPYGWTSKNYVICVCFRCHGSSSYHTTNTLQGRRAKSHVDTQTIQPGLGDFVL